MAEVIVLHNQADDLETSNANLPARAIGWVKALRVLNIAEDLGEGDVGGRFLIPSLVGQGMGRRVVSAAHGLVAGTALRLQVVSGAAQWALAQSTTDKALLATHLVVAVVDANTFDVAQVGAWALAGLPLGDLYLSDTTPGALTATAPTAHPAQRVGIFDGSGIHLTIAPPSGDSFDIDVLVTELNARTDLVAIPKGEAGGDLGGSYADPIVKQVTGIGADLVAIDCDFQFPSSSYGSPSGGRGVGYGRTFVGGVEVKSWVGQSEAGDLYWTVNHWKTTTHDESLKSTAGQRWNCIRFAWLAALNSFAWIAGDGYHKAFYYALHNAGNYNVDGTLKTSAWQTQTYTNGPTNVGDMSVHGSVICFVGNHQSLGYTNDFTNFVVKFTAGAVLGGVDTDQYGTWMAVERDTGVLWRSIDDGATWAQVASLTVDGAVVSHLPLGVQWGAINSAYGLWVASVWASSPVPGNTSYAYSEDGVNWFSFADPSPTSFYTCGFDGVRWYATNANELQSPPIYQMLVDSVPVKRRLALEKGAAVSGPVFLADLPDAAVLGTDQNGKVGAKTLGDLGGISQVLVSKGGVAAGGGKTLNFIQGANVTLSIVDQGDVVDVTVSSSGGGGGSSGVKYACTMKAASQTGNVTLNTGDVTQWAAHGTIMVPEADLVLTQNVSKFAVICPQPVNAASFILAVYAWPDTGVAMTLVAQTAVNVMPGSSSWLEAVMTSAGVTLTGGKRYFFVVLWNGNGATLAGTNGANLNVQPYLAFMKNNMGVLTTAPATLTAEGELSQHFFGRVAA